MNIFNLSFGKDSMATLLLAIEQGIPIDHVMYCDIRFSDEISGEHPLMAAWIPEAERILKEKFGIKVEHAFSISYVEQFYKIKKRGRVGSIYGFPFTLGSWCNRSLKVDAINFYLRKFKGVSINQFVGIAYDEPERWKRMLAKETEKRKYKSLLFEQKIIEQQAFEICERHNLLSPIYKGNDGIYRGGCWFCVKQCLSDLYSLWKNYPEYFNKLLFLEKDSPYTFRPDYKVIQLKELFENGYIPKRRKKREVYKQITIEDMQKW